MLHSKNGGEKLGVERDREDEQRRRPKGFASSLGAAAVALPILTFLHTVFTPSFRCLRCRSYSVCWDENGVFYYIGEEAVEAQQYSTVW